MRRNKKLSFFFPKADYLLTQLFTKKGWVAAPKLEKASLVVYSGGHDVCPSFYKENKLAGTLIDRPRDEREAKIFSIAKKKQIPQVGVCRGAQLLNVLNGGKLWQDVNGHARGKHEITDVGTKSSFIVTSTHHQMMRPHSSAELVAYAHESTYRKAFSHLRKTNRMVDPEVLFYLRTNCLCFQPHPEYDSILTANYFFELLETKMQIPGFKA